MCEFRRLSTGAINPGRGIVPALKPVCIQVKALRNLRKTAQKKTYSRIPAT
jgi:hypothetical protein